MNDFTIFYFRVFIESLVHEQNIWDLCNNIFSWFPEILMNFLLACLQNQELMTKGQLQDKGEKQDLINRIADYQEEVRVKLVQLKYRKQYMHFVNIK